MIKFIFDKDYHVVTDYYHITSVDQIEDDWAGYSYWYKETMDGPIFNSHKAREIFKPLQSLDSIFEENYVD